MQGADSRTVKAIAFGLIAVIPACAGIKERKSSISLLIRRVNRPYNAPFRKRTDCRFPGEMAVPSNAGGRTIGRRCATRRVS